VLSSLATQALASITLTNNPNIVEQNRFFMIHPSFGRTASATSMRANP
jgi:hypothetical protein